MENNTKSWFPTIIAAFGLIIALLGVYKQAKGGGSLAVWLGLAITFFGLFSAKKPKS